MNLQKIGLLVVFVIRSLDAKMTLMYHRYTNSLGKLTQRDAKDGY